MVEAADKSKSLGAPVNHFVQHLDLQPPGRAVREHPQLRCRFEKS
jgi:hypothetical protein